ncbi:CocE/NonD family hydrolase C-terminal non-catalytic domain-containing protein, partial [Streptomyces sp. NPDC005180]|uniref:CocE/NonD family hydrolase C-terminal non-catalytic domain-containing protein n=1 Tax=Streptomyces sp. NPDC005180 TaxID=3156868 RepID=UPI0033A78766
LPPDQRDEDAKSASFEFTVTEPLEVLGRPRVTLRLRMDVPFGQTVARLCDVAPDGSSTLLTHGVLDLSARAGRDRADAWPAGSAEDVTFELAGTGHTFAPGHRIRLAVSSAYWPWIWPRADSAGFTLDPAGSALELPVRAATGSATGSAATDADEAVDFEAPEHAEPLGVVVPVTLDPPRPGRLIVRDVAEGEWRLEVVPENGGTRVHPDGLEHTEQSVETYTIRENDPLSARTRSDWRIRHHRPDLAWDVTIETRSEIACDTGHFLTRIEARRAEREVETGEHGLVPDVPEQPHPLGPRDRLPPGVLVMRTDRQWEGAVELGQQRRAGRPVRDVGEAVEPCRGGAAEQRPDVQGRRPEHSAEQRRPAHRTQIGRASGRERVCM